VTGDVVLLSQAALLITHGPHLAVSYWFFLGLNIPRRLLEGLHEAVDGIFHQSELRHELARQPSVAVVNQADVSAKTGEFFLLRLDPVAQRASLAEQTLVAPEAASRRRSISRSESAGLISLFAVSAS